MRDLFSLSVFEISIMSGGRPLRIGIPFPECLSSFRRASEPPTTPKDIVQTPMNNSKRRQRREGIAINSTP